MQATATANHTNRPGTCITSVDARAKSSRLGTPLTYFALLFVMKRTMYIPRKL